MSDELSLTLDTEATAAAICPHVAADPVDELSKMASDSTGFPMASLYVGDLHPDVYELNLLEKFLPAGPILSITVCRDRTTLQSLGYAYVNFRQRADAERALELFNFEEIMGKPIRIMWSQRDPSLRKSGVGNIIITNLEKSIDSRALYDTFSVFGTILSCKVMCDEHGSKGFGFVHFECPKSAQRAIDRLHGMLFNDQQVYIAHFKPQKEYEAEISAKLNDAENQQSHSLSSKSEDLSTREAPETVPAALNQAEVTDLKQQDVDQDTATVMKTSLSPSQETGINNDVMPQDLVEDEAPEAVPEVPREPELTDGKQEDAYKDPASRTQAALSPIEDRTDIKPQEDPSLLIPTELTSSEAATENFTPALAESNKSSTAELLVEVIPSKTTIQKHLSEDSQAISLNQQSHSLSPMSEDLNTREAPEIVLAAQNQAEVTDLKQQDVDKDTAIVMKTSLSPSQETGANNDMPQDLVEDEAPEAGPEVPRRPELTDGKQKDAYKDPASRTQAALSTVQDRTDIKPQEDPNFLLPTQITPSEAAAEISAPAVAESHKSSTAELVAEVIPPKTSTQKHFTGNSQAVSLLPTGRNSNKRECRLFQMAIGDIKRQAKNGSRTKQVASQTLASKKNSTVSADELIPAKVTVGGDHHVHSCRMETGSSAVHTKNIKPHKDLGQDQAPEKPPAVLKEAAMYEPKQKDDYKEPSAEMETALLPVRKRNITRINDIQPRRKAVTEIPAKTVVETKKTTTAEMTAKSKPPKASPLKHHTEAGLAAPRMPTRKNNNGAARIFQMAIGGVKQQAKNGSNTGHVVPERLLPQKNPTSNADVLIPAKVTVGEDTNADSSIIATGPSPAQERTVTKENNILTDSPVDEAPEICPAELKQMDNSGPKQEDVNKNPASMMETGPSAEPDKTVINSNDIITPECLVKDEASDICPAVWKLSEISELKQEDVYRELHATVMETCPSEEQERTVINIDDITPHGDLSKDEAPETHPAMLEQMETSQEDVTEIPLPLGSSNPASPVCKELTPSNVTPSVQSDICCSNVIPSTSGDVYSSNSTASTLVTSPSISDKWTSDAIDRVKVAVMQEILKETCHFIFHQLFT